MMMTKTIVDKCVQGLQGLNAHVTLLKKGPKIEIFEAKFFKANHSGDCDAF